MATYVKGFKKKSSEHTLLITIVSIIGAVLLIVAAVFIYDLATDTGSYDDYNHIDKYDLILTQKDASNVQLQNYLVYFYSDTCTNCVDIKKDVLNYAKNINGEDTIIFFVNATTIAETTTGDKAAFIDIINEADSLRTPMLISIVDGVFYQKYVGTTNVTNILSQVDAGTYTPFN
jgi:thiol-disulfide isomerase/thioredoxin